MTTACTILHWWWGCYLELPNQQQCVERCRLRVRAETSEAATCCTHHEIWRNLNDTEVAHNFLEPSIQHTRHMNSAQQHQPYRPMRTSSLLTKLKRLRCEHWESAPVLTFSHSPIFLLLAPLTPQRRRPRLCCMTRYASSGHVGFHQHGAWHGFVCCFSYWLFLIILPGLSCSACVKFHAGFNNISLICLTTCFLTAGADYCSCIHYVLGHGLENMKHEQRRPHQFWSNRPTPVTLLEHWFVPPPRF